MKTPSGPLPARVGGLETMGKVYRSRKSSKCSRTRCAFPVVPWLLCTGSMYVVVQKA